MRPLLPFVRLDAAIRRALIPARLWMSVQHFTGLMFFFFGLTTLSDPSEPFEALTKLPLFENIIPFVALLFVFFAALLCFVETGEVGFRVCLTPLYLTLGVVFWYRLSGQTESWLGVLFVVFIIGLLWFLRMEPEGSTHDHTGGI